MNEHFGNNKKEIIKNAAKELFFRFGFGKTSMDDIAKRSKLAKPTLYYYYQNKDAIFNEIVVEEATIFMNQVESKLPGHLPPDEKIAFFIWTIYSDMKQYNEEMKDLPEVICQHSPHGRPILEKITTLFSEKLRPLLENARVEKKIHFENLDSTISALIFMLRFLNLEWMQRYPENLRDQVVENVIHIILNGLRRRN